MNRVAQRERLSQQQVLEFFQHNSRCRTLNNWKDRANVRSLGLEPLRNWLTYLSGIDTGIELRERRPDNADKIKQGKVQQLLTRRVWLI
jgi:type I restriction enzyme R subunit